MQVAPPHHSNKHHSNKHQIKCEFILSDWLSHDFTTKSLSRLVVLVIKTGTSYPPPQKNANDSSHDQGTLFHMGKVQVQFFVQSSVISILVSDYYPMYICL